MAGCFFFMEGMNGVREGRWSEGVATVPVLFMTSPLPQDNRPLPESPLDSGHVLGEEQFQLR